MTTYYRLNRSDEVDALLDPERWGSWPWAEGPVRLACPTCGRDVDTDRVDGYGECRTCGWVDLTGERPGVSVCRTMGDLHAYLRDRDPDLDGAVVVELAGDPVPGVYDHDANTPGDPLLIYPREIVAVTPVVETDLA